MIITIVTGHNVDIVASKVWLVLTGVTEPNTSQNPVNYVMPIRPSHIPPCWRFVNFEKLISETGLQIAGVMA